MRSRRRDTWVPPYRVHASGRTESSAPTRGRRGRRPLRTLSLRGAKRRGNPFSFLRADSHASVRRSCAADRDVRRDGISAGTRAVERQGTHHGSGQRRATAHRGKLWRHDPLNRENRKTGCAWDRSARNHSRRARGSLETQFQAAFLVTFVAADKSHPPEAKKEGVPRLRTWGTSGVRRSCGADRDVRPYNGTSGTPSPTKDVPEVKQGRQPCGCLPLVIWVYRWRAAYLSYISTSFSRCS